MKKRGLTWLTGIIVLFVIFIGPWPINDPPYVEGEYYQHTLNSLQQLAVDKSDGALTGNIAQVDITPEGEFSLGGFAARKPKLTREIRTPLKASALTLSNQHKTVTIINAEILLPLPLLVEQVSARTAIPREQLFFSASHTHSGPGAYEDSWLLEFTLGDYDADATETLLSKISAAVLASRQNLAPVQLEYHRIAPQTETPLTRHGLQSKKASVTAYETIHVLSLLDGQGNRRGMLIGFGAHPTLLGRDNHQLDGDYPGRLTMHLSQQLNIPVMFASSAPGATSAQISGQESGVEGQVRDAQRYAQTLAQQIHSTISSQTGTRWSNGTVDSLLLPVRLNSLHLQLGKHLRVSPILSQALLHPDNTYIHALNLDKVLLLSFPADYAGGLAAELEASLPQQGCMPFPLSFNGDYIGYVSPSADMDIPHYTTRDVNFFGRWTGDYFNDLARAMCNKFRANASIP
ncbi:MAG: neutral/alkaline non-lysosomal ceramidase N-terminal domain-containing protein [Gammaproteobacteria bacterium]|nr:neutral/alkaline non-lysosomal ceramidase N-terminal domain-containing protein [Gammaproteobacteria bacterium]